MTTLLQFRMIFRFSVWALLGLFLFSAAFATEEQLEKKEWPEAHLSLLVPQGWHTLMEKVDDSPVFHVSPEPLESSAVPYQVGLAINILRGVPSMMGQKPSEYASTLIDQIRERSEKEITVHASQSAPYQLYRVEYSLLNENESLKVVNLLEANDSTGTLYMVVWQAPESKEKAVSETREKILSSIQLDPVF